MEISLVPISHFPQRFEINNSCIYLQRFRFPISRSGLKGNRVRIPDSPAAVFSTTVIQSNGHCPPKADGKAG